MRRVILTTLATVLGLVLLLSFKSHGVSPRGGVSALGVLSAPPVVPSSAAPTTPAAGSPSPAPPTTPTAGPSTMHRSTPAPSPASRTVVGQPVDTQYGPVQVQITVAGGRIASVGVLQVPLGTSLDQQINSYAVPALNQEAINAQSAQIDSVSGASYTSDGYIRSLQSALDTAHLR